jgi:chorismate mutase
MSLEPIREKIDELDRQLVRLVNERLALAAEIGKIKRSQVVSQTAGRHRGRFHGSRRPGA